MNLTNKRRSNQHKRFDADGADIPTDGGGVDNFICPTLERVKNFIADIDRNTTTAGEDDDDLDDEYVTAPEEEARGEDVDAASGSTDSFFDNRFSALETVSEKL